MSDDVRSLLESSRRAARGGDGGGDFRALAARTFLGTIWNAGRKNLVLSCRFYQTPTGNEPVREWLKTLSKDARHAIGTDTALVQTNWPVGKPLVDGFGGGLYEVRTSIDGNIYRVLFCLDGSTMVLLHGFQKKSQKTPKADLELARRRMRDEEKKA